MVVFFEKECYNTLKFLQNPIERTVNMSKVVCEVCGTSYAATAEKCPICGNKTPVKAEKTAGNSTSKRSSSGNVRGGKFSKSNVKKRNLAAQKQSAAVSRNAGEPKPRMEEGKKKKSSWRVILVIVLLLLLGAATFFATEHFLPMLDEWLLSGGIKVSSPASEEKEMLTAGIRPCQGIDVGRSQIVFSRKGDMLIMDARPEPTDTTDPMYFSSSDENVVTVDSNGMLIAVGSGEATITVKCGEYTASCVVLCTFSEGEDNAPAETIPAETKEPDDGKKFELSCTDVTLYFKGDTWLLYVNGVDSEDITWKSDDPDIVTVENGELKAIRGGTTMIFAYYDGKSDSCIVRCNFPDEVDGGDDENQSSGGNDEHEDKPAEYIINHIDVTVYSGSSFELRLEDSDGFYVDVEWISRDSDIAIVDGNTVTGFYAGMTTVYCEYEGKTYQCIVRVVYPDSD